MNPGAAGSAFGISTTGCSGAVPWSVRARDDDLAAPGLTSMAGRGGGEEGPPSFGNGGAGEGCMRRLAGAGGALPGSTFLALAPGAVRASVGGCASAGACGGEAEERPRRCALGDGAGSLPARGVAPCTTITACRPSSAGTFTTEAADGTALGTNPGASAAASDGGAAGGAAAFGGVAGTCTSAAGAGTGACAGVAGARRRGKGSSIFTTGTRGTCLAARLGLLVPVPTLGG